jgi:hypothetical protein
MSIVASTLLMALWNTSFSWDSEIVPSLQSSNNPIQQAIANEWVKNQIIPVGILGINLRVSVSDLSVIGSASMLVIITWYFYSQKRENRAIVGLLRDCAEGYKERRLNKSICSMAFQGIVHSLVFIDLEKGGVPLLGLKSEEARKPPEILKAKEKPTLWTEWVVKGLAYLPPITIILIVLLDIRSLVQPSIIRSNGDALWSILSSSQHIKIVMFESTAIVSAVYTWFLCYRSTQFSKATAATLIDYMEFLKDPEKLETLLDKYG